MFIAREDVPPQGFLRPRLVDKNQVSFALIREWLSECDDAHGKKCSHHPWATSSDSPSTLRVIDVQNDCLVTAPPDCRYITLSYVWGAGKTVTLHEKDMPSLSMPGSLLKHHGSVAQTILDAMKLTREIGERYLWVDGICIFQDSADKATQIAAMDQVYSNSMLTIVAASGIDSSAGLPGVRHGSRQDHPQQKVASASNVHFFKPMPPPPSLSLSKWNTRGW
ncbi:HET-domain-containing protein, partial [Cadophora sp. DSE1049]